MDNEMLYLIVLTDSLPRFRLMVRERERDTQRDCWWSCHLPDCWRRCILVSSSVKVRCTLAKQHSRKHDREGANCHNTTIAALYYIPETKRRRVSWRPLLEFSRESLDNFTPMPRAGDSVYTTRVGVGSQPNRPENVYSRHVRVITWDTIAPKSREFRNYEYVIERHVAAFT